MKFSGGALNMISQFYMPVLKSKHGEFLALSKLREEIKNKVVPLIEITPLEWSAEGKKPKTLEDHLDLFCKRFKQNWNGNSCFIDTVLMNWAGTDNTHRIEYVFDVLAKDKLIPVPVVHIQSSENFITAINNIHQKYGVKEFGIRVTPDQMTSLEFADDIFLLLKKIQSTANSCHLIFDLVSSDFSEIDNLALGIDAILSEFPYLSEWKSFTLTGSAFPSSKSIKEGMSEFDRNDWKFFNKLSGIIKDKDYRRDINFGDYSIVNPGYFEFDPRFMKPSANIKYTLDDKWVITKGKKLGAAKDYAQYKALASNIANADFYLGENFSDGDLYIANCAAGIVGTGQPRTWVWVGHNHHITKTASDLFATLADFSST